MRVPIRAISDDLCWLRQFCDDEAEIESMGLIAFRSQASRFNSAPDAPGPGGCRAGRRP